MGQQHHDQLSRALLFDRGPLLDRERGHPADHSTGSRSSAPLCSRRCRNGTFSVVLTNAFLAIAAVIAGGVLLIVGVVFLGAAIAAVGVGRASAGWPAAPGRVVRSEIRDNRRANGLPGYRSVVRYQYVIDGEEYEGRDVASGEFPYRSALSATRRLAAYPIGALVTVRYCPAEPEVAVLEPGVSLDVLYLPTIASLLLVAALALASWGTWRLFHVIPG
jgi:hypothetical protein